MAAGIGGASAFTVWFHFLALPTFAPEFASVGMRVSWSEWFWFATILVGLVTWLTIRLANEDEQGIRVETVVWRPCHLRFLHEGLWFAIATLICAAWYFVWEFLNVISFSMTPGMSWGWTDSVRWEFTKLTNYFWLAILVFSVRSLVSRWRNWPTVGVETAIQPVSARRFAIFFAATLLVVASGVGATYGFLIAWWLGPWYEWPWPEWLV